MSKDETVTAEASTVLEVPRGAIEAEGTITPDTDEAQVYADVADAALNQTTQPLVVLSVERWPRGGGATIVHAVCEQDASGTRVRKALGAQIAAWEATAVP